jgi:hypothetical protein
MTNPMGANKFIVLRLRFEISSMKANAKKIPEYNSFTIVSIPHPVWGFKRVVAACL